MTVDRIPYVGGRGAIGALTALLALLVTATPASAKGISRAHFEGPGLPAGGLKVVNVMGIQRVGLVAPKEKSLAALGLNREDLGTPYRAKYSMDYAPRRWLRQVVYPYAFGGTVTFTPKGQHLGQDYESFRGGWYSSGPRLLRLLAAHGFPPKDPSNPLAADSEQQDSERARSTIDASGTWNRWRLMGGVFLFLVLGATAVTRIHGNKHANIKVHPPRVAPYDSR